MTVNLRKGTRIRLIESDGSPLHSIRMGLSWQAKYRKGLLARFTNGRDIDLDASAVLFSGRTRVDAVFFKQLVSKDGSVRHTGDHGTDGDGYSWDDDEAVVVNLASVPAHVDQIVFAVTSFSGQTLQKVSSVCFRFADEISGMVLAEYTFGGQGAHTAWIVARLERSTTVGGWALVVDDLPANGRTIDDLMPTFASYL
jgi:tellurium resistance protein TerZ